MNIKAVLKRFYLSLRHVLLAVIGIGVRKSVPDAMGVKSILAIRIDRIGDMMVSLPAIKALKDIFPGARVTVLAAEGTSALLKIFPWIDGVATYKGLADTARLLKRRRFDLAVDFLMDYRMKTAVLTRLAGSRTTAGFDIAGRGRCFNIRFRPEGKKDVGAYMLDLVRAVGKAFAIKTDTDGKVEFLIPSETKEYASSFYGGSSDFNGLKVGIHPGGHFPAQQWPVENFARLADRIIERYGAGIVIFGAAGERDLIDNMASLMKGRPLKAVGLALDKAAALISMMDLFVCNNSGPLHIACALGAPTVSTMGPTDPGLWWPKGEGHIVLRKGVGCSPCDLPACPDHRCIKLITVDEMFGAVSQQLERRKNG